MLSMLRVRPAAALLALIGLIAPGASTAVVTLHLFTDHADGHHAEDHAATTDLSVLWHGHGHEATTPEHDHLLLVAGLQGFRFPAIHQYLQGLPALWHPAAFGEAGATRDARQRPPALEGVGPPPQPDRLSILRI